MDDFKEKQRLLDTAGQLHYELTAVLVAGTRSAQGEAEQKQSQQEGEKRRWAPCPSRSCGAMVAYHYWEIECQVSLIPSRLTPL